MQELGNLFCGSICPWFIGTKGGVNGFQEVAEIVYQCWNIHSS